MKKVIEVRQLCKALVFHLLPARANKNHRCFRRMDCDRSQRLAQQLQRLLLRSALGELFEREDGDVARAARCSQDVVQVGEALLASPVQYGEHLGALSRAIKELHHLPRRRLDD